MGAVFMIGILSWLVLPRTILAERSSGARTGLSTLGVSVQIPDDLKDLKFASTLLDPKGTISADADAIGAFQGTEELEAAGNPCTTNIAKAPLGTVYKVKGAYNDQAARSKSKGELVKQFSTFFVTYDSNGESACKDNEYIQKHAEELKPRIKKILQTIED